jgi:hypothetical protein
MGGVSNDLFSLFLQVKIPESRSYSISRAADDNKRRRKANFFLLPCPVYYPKAGVMMIILGIITFLQKANVG